MILTVTNNKGGCGKTVSAINLGAGLRRAGANVLLIDLDGQANLTAALRGFGEQTTYEMMCGGRSIPAVNVKLPDRTGGALDILPSSRNLSALEVEMAAQEDRVTRLRDILIKNGYRDRYKYIIIDTPPSLGILTLNALYACDAAVITVEAEFLAVQGLVSIQDTIKAVAGFRGTKLPYKVLFTKFDKRKSLHNMTVEQVEASKVPIFDTRIRTNVALGESPAAGVDIFTYEPGSYGAEDYAALTEEIINWNIRR